MNVTPPTTRSKGKSKIRKSVWEEPATALGQAHNVTVNEELKDLASIPSHELVNHHIHKLVQVFYLIVILPLNFYLDCRFDYVFFLYVLGETLRLTTNYLSNEEKVVVANSKVEFVEV